MTQWITGRFHIYPPAAAAAACVSLLIVSVAVNVVQAERLRSYEIGSRRERLVGTQLGAIALGTTAAASARIAFADVATDTVIYYYSPACGWCRRNEARVTALRQALRGRMRFIALTTDPNHSLEHATALDPDLHGYIDHTTRRVVGLGGTPHTIVVSRDGVIRQSWRGAYNGRIKREVEWYFGITLP